MLVAHKNEGMEKGNGKLLVRVQGLGNGKDFAQSYLLENLDFLKDPSLPSRFRTSKLKNSRQDEVLDVREVAAKVPLEPVAQMILG